jgi:adenylate cyclase
MLKLRSRSADPDPVPSAGFSRKSPTVEEPDGAGGERPSESRAKPRYAVAMPGISFGPYRFDATLMSLTRDREPVGLNARGAALLAALLDARGATVSRQALLEAGWPGLTVEEANLTVQIGVLRKLLGNQPDGRDWIATVPRIGYRLHCDEPKIADGTPSIAVLPFQNMSGDPEQEYFADGITEDLITALSRLRGFFVIARNSTFAYKGKTPDIRQMARELGVRYVLEGSVRQAGDRLRVTAQLIDASTGNHIWAERYDRPVADIFAVQDEITASIAATIEGKLYTAETFRVKARATESLDAWGCLVRANPFAPVVAIADDEPRLNLLRRAIELDPGYAQPYALMAWMHCNRAVLGKEDHDTEIAMALRFARRAIELDPDDPWGHHALGYAYAASRRTDQAIEELNAALARNPNFARSETVLGGTYANAGLIDEAMRHLAIATRLSPRDITEPPILYIYGLCHFLAGRYSEAIVSSRRAVELRQHYSVPWRTLAAAAGLAGDRDTASHALSEAKRLQPSLSIDWIERYEPLVRLEDRARFIDGLMKAGLN